MADQTLHALCGRLLREQTETDLTERQDWLVDRLLDELAWRRARALSLRLMPCTCAMCMPSEWYDS